MENTNLDIRSPADSIYRELGQIEGRVRALEDTTRDIKNMLGTMMVQLTSIQSTVSTFIGKRDGAEASSERTWSYLERLVTVSISALTAYLIVKYGK